MTSPVEQVRRALNSDATKANLFRLPENESFHLEPVAALFPELAEHWQRLADAMQVPWQFVMVLDLTLAAALAPTAVLFPLPTLPVHPVLWWFLFHPGAYNTSAIIKLYSEVLQLVEEDINAARAERRRVWAEQPESHGTNPYSGRVSFSGGSGSLEGEGKQMALPRNLGRSISFLTEGKRLLRWLQAEGSVNETIVLELFERMLWKRSTVNADKSFTVNHPYFLAAGALHVEDVIELFVGNDPLGIRGRLGLFYARATFKRANDVRTAAESLTTRRPVEEGARALLFFASLATPLLDRSGGAFKTSCANALLVAGKPTIPSMAIRSSAAFFDNFRGGQWRVYELDADARRSFDELYDQHTESQRQAHLVDLNNSRWHSKAKTKHLRHAFAVHLCEQTRLGGEGEAWSCRLSVKALDFGARLSDYMDSVDKKNRAVLHRDSGGDSCGGWSAYRWGRSWSHQNAGS